MRSALGIVYVIWGSTYLAIRVMVEDLPPLLAAGARFLVAGAALIVASVAAIVTRESATRREPQPETTEAKRCITQPAAVDSVS